jgi:tRNA 2-thiouridine synthesizing protein A
MPSPETSPHMLDAIGKQCPWPLIITKQTLSVMPNGATLIVLADDPLAELDLRDLCERSGHELLLIAANPNGPGFAIHIRKALRA